MLRFIREKEADDRDAGERDEGEAKVGCTDMFTREGNIPHTNRNEKPTAAAKQPPAAYFRGLCTRDEIERVENSETEAGGKEKSRPS